MSGAPRLSREAFLRSSGVSLGTILVAGAGGLSYRAYDQGVLEPGRGPAYAPWSHWQEHRGLLPLVAAATLAPSPHNAQRGCSGSRRTASISSPTQAAAPGRSTRSSGSCTSASERHWRTSSLPPTPMAW